MEYSQSGGMVSDMEVGSRVQNVIGGDGGPDMGQGPLQGGQPGDRVRNLLGGDEDGADVSQGLGSDFSVPDNPGPAVLGRTPALGSLRRDSGMPVIRDNLSGVMQ